MSNTNVHKSSDLSETGCFLLDRFQRSLAKCRHFRFNWFKLICVVVLQPSSKCKINEFDFENCFRLNVDDMILFVKSINWIRWDDNCTCCTYFLGTTSKSDGISRIAQRVLLWVWEHEKPQCDNILMRLFYVNCCPILHTYIFFNFEISARQWAHSHCNEANVFSNEFVGRLSIPFKFSHSLTDDLCESGIFGFEIFACPFFAHSLHFIVFFCLNLEYVCVQLLFFWPTVFHINNWLWLSIWIGPWFANNRTTDAIRRWWRPSMFSTHDIDAAQLLTQT